MVYKMTRGLDQGRHSSVYGRVDRKCAELFVTRFMFIMLKNGLDNNLETNAAFYRKIINTSIVAKA